MIFKKWFFFLSSSFRSGSSIQLSLETKRKNIIFNFSHSFKKTFSLNKLMNSRTNVWIYGIYFQMSNHSNITFSSRLDESKRKKLKHNFSNYDLFQTWTKQGRINQKADTAKFLGPTRKKGLKLFKNELKRLTKHKMKPMNALCKCLG